MTTDTTDSRHAIILADVLDALRARNEELAAELDAVRRELAASPAPPSCRTDLSCCVPDSPGPVDLELSARRPERIGQ